MALYNQRLAFVFLIFLVASMYSESARAEDKIGSFGVSFTDWNADLSDSHPIMFDDSIRALALDIWFSKRGNRYYTFDLDWAMDAEVDVPDQPDGTDTSAFSTGFGIAQKFRDGSAFSPFIKIGFRYTSISVEGDLFNNTGVNACEEGASSLCVELADADELAPAWSVGFDTEKLRISYEQIAGDEIEIDGFKIAYVNQF